MDYLEYKNHLAHSGVKGQKWGTRRWQNADGSLTPEGRAHYGVGEARAYSGKGGFSKLGAMTRDRINFKKNYTAAKTSDTVRAVGKAYGTVGNAVGTGARVAGQKYRTGAEVLGTSAEGVAKGIVPTVKKGYLSKDARAIRKDTRQEVRGEVKELRSNVKDLNKLGRMEAKEGIKNTNAFARDARGASRQAKKEYTDAMISKYGKKQVKAYNRAVRSGKILATAAIVSLVAGGVILGSEGVRTSKIKKDNAEMNAAQDKFMRERAAERARAAEDAKTQAAVEQLRREHEFESAKNYANFDDEINKRRNNGAGQGIGYR